LEIGTLISAQNPQWTDKNYLPTENSWSRREALSKIRKWFDKRFILALVGLRRVGKSTILKQIISDLIINDKRKKCL